VVPGSGKRVTKMDIVILDIVIIQPDLNLWQIRLEFAYFLKEFAVLLLPQ
jgi:hypothetical protein